MSTGLKRLNEQSYSPGLNGNVMNPLVNIPFKRQDDEVALSGVQTFTRASTGTYIDPLDGLVKTAASNTPRFEKMNDGGTGILMEGASTNIYSNSQFPIAGSVTNATSTPNSDISPDGTNTALKVVQTVSSNVNTLVGYNGLGTLVIGNVYTFSIYVKSAGSPRVGVRLYPGHQIVNSLAYYLIHLTFEFATESFITNNYGVNLKATKLQNGWYRISGTSNGNIENVTLGLSLESLSATATCQGANSTGNGVDGVLFWGAQTEQLPFASSYIPTTTTSVTRSADNLSILANGNNKSDEITVIADVQYTHSDYNTIISSLSYNIDGWELTALSATFRGQITLTPNNKPNIVHRVAFTASLSNGMYSYIDGILESVSDIPTPTPFTMLNNIDIASQLANGRKFSGYIRSFRIYDRVLTQAEMLLA